MPVLARVPAPPPKRPTKGSRLGSRGAAVMSEGAEAEATQSPEYRAAQAAEQAATAERRRSQVTEMAFSAEETDALTKASKSLQSCWTGKPEDCPASLKNIFTQQPKDLFAVLAALSAASLACCFSPAGSPLRSSSA